MEFVGDAGCGRRSFACAQRRQSGSPKGEPCRACRLGGRSRGALAMAAAPSDARLDAAAELEATRPGEAIALYEAIITGPGGAEAAVLRS